MLRKERFSPVFKQQIVTYDGVCYENNQAKMEEICKEFCAANSTDQAPVNICLQDTKPVALPDLAFSNYDVTPTKMKINNTGYTATVSGKFADGTFPQVCGGPLTSPYRFSQLHFHWGHRGCGGSEHTMECRRMPFEMHVVHINSKYANQEAALKQKDGVVILSYFFVPGKTNSALQALLNDLPQINKPHSSFRITPRPVSSIVPQFCRDYFTYWGSVISPGCAHLIQWLICRVPLELSPDQLEPFRKLLNVNNEPLLRNYRDIQPLGNRKIFHCSPGSRKGAAINLSASRIALLQLVDPCECPATDVENACTSLEEADSKSKVSFPQSAKASTASTRAPSPTSCPPKSPSRPFTSTPEVVHVCVPIDQVRRTTPECLETSLKSSDIGALSMQSVPQGGATTTLSSGKQPSVAESCEAPKSEEATSREDAKSEEAAKSCEDAKSEEAAKSREDVKSEEAAKTCEDIKSEEAAKSCKDVKSEEAAKSCKDVKSEEAAKICEDIKSEEGAKSCEDAKSEEAAKSCEDAKSEEAAKSKEVAKYEEECVPVVGDEIQSASAQDRQQLAEDQKHTAERPSRISQASQRCCRPYSTSQAGLDGPRPSSRGFMSRGINFNNIPEIIQRSENEFPDNPFTNETLRSPVDIDVRDAKRMSLPPLQFEHHFEPGSGLSLMNSGETVQVDYLQCIDHPYLSGGPLQEKYRLDSIHFHWIPCDELDGGTHTINNTRTEIELHMVHVKDTYSSKTEAMAHPNALAVVSFLLQVGGEECAAFAKICQSLHKIRELYCKAELPDADLAWLASAAKPHDYFLYPGRFFGRKDGQPVLWFVYAQPVGICCQNVAQFQKLKMAADYKPHETYPLENRPLIAAVPMDSVPGSGSEASAADAIPLGRTASGHIATIPRDQWPNVPYKSEHMCLCAPLDISTECVENLPLPPLEFVGHFIPSVTMELKNTGEAVNIKWREVSPMPHLTGGPLLEDYEFDSAHFHWAQNPDDFGAMHRINSRRFELECHMVHFRKSCHTREAAMFASDGLCVVSFLLQVGGEDNPSFAQIAEALPNIRKVDTTTEIQGSLCYLQNRAGPHGYFLYPGTLFGADKGINVIWIVYPTPVLVCCQYVAQFYKLECTDIDRMHTIHEILGRPIYHARDPQSCGR